VATVQNIDWPSKPGLPAEHMRAEMVRILDAAARMNLNAIFLQVRPSCDAIYPSALEPWTEYLSGVQGNAPVGGGAGFDPLAEWIAASHERGLELHAWFNPFRAKHKEAKSPLAASHVGKRRPDLVRTFDGQLWLDPGSAEARETAMAAILDVVKRYDIDGVHFDDYFYPYPKAGETFADSGMYAQYKSGGGTLVLGDWRRGNVNTFVQQVYDRIHQAKPQLRVGISPFGIWRPNNPPGIKGLDAYESLYADSLHWLTAGWVDYLAPQLYWKIESPQPYVALLDWWVSASARSQRRPIIAGNYTSRIPEKAGDAKSWTASEILNQVARTREHGGAGNIHFSAAALLQNRGGIADSLAQGEYSEAALPPEMPWLAHTPRAVAPRVEVTTPGTSTVHVRWDAAPAGGLRRWIVSAHYGSHWVQHIVGGRTQCELPRQTASGMLGSVSVCEVDGCGRIGAPATVLVGVQGPKIKETTTVSP
jgi:uncharacterized lipoprotein YddW (UPF0748 family)